MTEIQAMDAKQARIVETARTAVLVITPQPRPEIEWAIALMAGAQIAGLS